MTDPARSLQMIGSTLNEFMEVSSLKVNVSKSLSDPISLSDIQSHFI